MAKNRIPKLLSMANLETKGTRELLSYLGKLRKCEESFERSDMTENIDLRDNEHIYFKNTDKWKVAYQSVKRILANREHIE